MDRERPADRPALDRRVGDVAHDLAVALHALALKGRLHQAPLAQVPRPVEEQQGVLSEQGFEERVRLAGAESLPVASEELPDCLRVGEDDEGRPP